MSIAIPNRTCPECGAKFVATNGRQRFCTPGHQRAFHNLMMTRGKVLLPLALTWRAGKHGGKAEHSYAFGQLCRMLDRFNAEDRAAGRSASLVVRHKMEARWMACDLVG